MDDENIKNGQLFDSLDEEENTTEEADDEMMNVSGGSGGSSTDEDEEMLRWNESSSNTFQNSVECMVEEILMKMMMNILDANGVVDLRLEDHKTRQEILLVRFSVS
jgi:hypothetical protein